MLPIASQMAGPIGLKFFVDTHGRPWGVIDKENLKLFLFKKKIATKNFWDFLLNLFTRK